MATILSKSGYAKWCAVKPGAVSNWIRRRQLTPPALRADGTIDAEMADRQLGRSVNPMMAAAKRTLPVPSAVRGGAGVAGGGGDPAWSREAQAQLQILQARAVQAAVGAETAKRKLALERGKYTLTEQAQAEFAGILSKFLLNVEQSLPDLASALGLDRERQGALRRWWRNHRTRAAEENRLAATKDPEFVDDVA